MYDDINPKLAHYIDFQMQLFPSTPFTVHDIPSFPSYFSSTFIRKIDSGTKLKRRTRNDRDKVKPKHTQLFLFGIFHCKQVTMGQWALKYGLKKEDSTGIFLLIFLWDRISEIQTSDYQQALSLVFMPESRVDEHQVRLTCSWKNKIMYCAS